MGVIAHYDASGVNGTTLTDLSGNGNHATLTNGPYANETYIALVNSSYILLPDLLASCPNGLTASILLSITSNNNYPAVFSFAKASGNRDDLWKLSKRQTNNTNTYVEVRIGSTPYGSSDAVGLNIGQQLRLTATHDNATTTVKQYQNNTELTSGSLPYFTSVSRPYSTIGRDADASSDALQASFFSAVICDEAINTAQLAIVNRIGTPEPYYFKGCIEVFGVPKQWEVHLWSDEQGMWVDKVTAGPDGKYTLYSMFSGQHSAFIVNPTDNQNHILISKGLPNGKIGG